MNTSVEVFQKRLPHRSMPDWHLGLTELRNTARGKRHDAFDLRNLSVQLRNETAITTKWDTYKNNERLRDRIFNVDLWRNELQNTLENVNMEIYALKQEKINTEKCMDALHIPLSVVSDCLLNRDSRRITETTQDKLDAELKKELFIVDSNRKHLADVCCDAWEKLNKLDAIKRRLQIEISNKSEAINIDEDQMNLDKHSSGISYKVEPFRLIQNSITEDSWLDFTKDTIKIADMIMMESKNTREILFKAREQSKNELDTQKNLVEHVLRKRIFDTQKSRNELQWQQTKMKDAMMKAAIEIKTLENALFAKINVGKLVETRAENRTYRPYLELVRDRVLEGLEEESKNVKKTMYSLQNKIDHMKSNYNAMEKVLSDIEKDLDDKEDTLEIDSRCLEIRVPLMYTNVTQTARNVGLTNACDEIAPQ